MSSTLVAAGSALAADLPVKARPMAAALPYNWSGCHVGAHVGAGWDLTTYSDPGTLSPVLFGPPSAIVQNFAPADAAFSARGPAAFLGGVQAGCDYQFSNHWVVGIGGDISWTNLSSLTNDPFFGGKNGGPVPFSSRTSEIATITGRVGYAWDRVLFYGKGGAAYAHDKYGQRNSAAINNTIFGCLPAGATLDVGCDTGASVDRWGWTAGVGAEWAFAANWTAMIEYDHYSFDAKTLSMNVLNNQAPILPANLTVGHDIDTIKVGINYRFWSPGPVARN